MSFRSQNKRLAPSRLAADISAARRLLSMRSPCLQSVNSRPARSKLADTATA